MKECEQFEEGSRKRAICEGRAALHPSKINFYRARWGLPPLSITTTIQHVVQPQKSIKPSRVVTTSRQNVGCGSCGKKVRRQRAERSLPSKRAQVATFIKASVRHVSDGLAQAPREVIEHRLSVCQNCDRYRHSDSRCSECGCYVAEKASWRSEDCPLGKWSAKTWAYGVTTVPERRRDLLPSTLESLRAAGFDSPRLFVDGPPDGFEQFGLAVTARHERVRTFANWILTITELYQRNPTADRFAVFQDDLLACRNLRQYLDTCEYPKDGYWNLFTFPSNQSRVETESVGWFKSNQKGLGAVGLVFSREAVETLLSSKHMILYPQNREKGWKLVDMAIAKAMNDSGWSEYCHNPSLIEHVGTKSSMGSPRLPQSQTFLGVDFDANELTDLRYQEQDTRQT